MEKYGEIKLTINLVIPQEIILGGKQKIAEYINNKLYDDPDFFDNYGEENVEIVTEDIDGVTA